MSVSLYRKYRPQIFSDLIGQSPAVSVLTNSIIRGKIGHAYLFSGSRGCGKTSAARIFAKALNCLDREGFEPCGKCRNCTEITAGESLDVIEIDGASNNGVDNIRGLKENVTLSPFNSRYKIYIIDEVHMLSQGAFNALLKTLEEPPEHVIFIMATTEPHKVPVTIRSRCQHIPFRSIMPDDIFARLEYVCKSEGITYEAEGLREISRQADGALRDGLSLLEQVSSSGEVTLKNVEAVFGAGSRPAFERWITGFREHPEGSYSELKAMFDAGASPVRVFEELFSLLRDLWLVSKWKNVADALGLSEQEREFLVDEASHWKSDDLQNIIQSALNVLTEARSGVRNDVLLGMFMLMLYAPAASAVTPATSQPMPTTPATPEPVTPMPVAPDPVTPAMPATPDPATPDDPELRGELMELSADSNFMIYCALYDARAYIRGNDLILDMKHRYTYEVMTVDKRAFEVRKLFSRWDDVIIRWLKKEYICPKPVDTPEFRPPAQDTPMPSVTTDNIHVTLPIEPSQPQPQKVSAFTEIINSLKYYQMNPDILIVKRNEADDDIDDDTDDTEGDNDE